MAISRRLCLVKSISLVQLFIKQDEQKTKVGKISELPTIF